MSRAARLARWGFYGAPTAVLGALLLSALLVGTAGVPDEALGLTCEGHVQSSDPYGLCFDGDRAAELEAVAELEARELAVGCVPASSWPSGQLATAAVVRPVDGGDAVRLSFDAAWELASSGQAWTLYLCP